MVVLRKVQLALGAALFIEIKFCNWVQSLRMRVFHSVQLGALWQHLARLGAYVSGHLKVTLARWSKQKTWRKLSQPQQKQRLSHLAQHKISHQAVYQTMLDAFILSRLCLGDVMLFVITIRQLRVVLSAMQLAPKKGSECEQAILHLQDVQKKLIGIDYRYELIIKNFEQEPRTRILAETIKAKLHRIFDFCNLLIVRLNHLKVHLQA
jgi:hypothetical protein